MTVKKVAIIAAAGAVLLAGALTLSMTLITRNKIEVTATETSAQNETEQEEDGVKTLENMENMPLYFEDTEKLLLPLRNTMEALGGTVKWDTEKKQTAISYRGRTLRVRSGERDAVLNGYAVTLPEEPNMINGCLYVDEEVISAYYTGEVRFNHETKQVTLEMKDGTEPVVAVKELTADEENGGYSVDVPVIVGLNDANYEKSLNDSLMQQMQDYQNYGKACDGLHYSIYGGGKYGGQPFAGAGDNGLLHEGFSFDSLGRDEERHACALCKKP